MLNEKRLNKIINEEITKTEVESLIRSKMSSKEMENKIQDVCAKAISDLFKVLWQRDSVWKSSIKK